MTITVLISVTVFIAGFYNYLLLHIPYFLCLQQARKLSMVL